MKVPACHCTSQKSVGTAASEENVENLQPKFHRKPCFGIPSGLNILTGKDWGVIEEVRNNMCDRIGLLKHE